VVVVLEAAELDVVVLAKVGLGLIMIVVVVVVVVVVVEVEGCVIATTLILIGAADVPMMNPVKNSRIPTTKSASRIRIMSVMGGITALIVLPAASFSCCKEVAE